MKTQVLVISHSPFDYSYGASTSLREHYKAMSLLNKYNFIHVSKAWPREAIFMAFKEHHPKRLYIPANVTRIFNACLPWSDNFDTSIQYDVTDIKKSIVKWVLNTNWELKYKKVINTLFTFNPRIIHLNSLVLTGTVRHLRVKNQKIPIISHVREMLNCEITKEDKQAILQLDAVLPIDYAVEQRFIEVIPEYPRERIHLIQNPFCSFALDASLQKLFSDSNHVFAVAGVISPDKGVDFICECFCEAKLKNSILIIFGSTDSEYASSIRTKWMNTTKTIVWAGEQEFLFEKGAYSRIDVVVRGDISFRTGRTVYEGLFAGTRVILQGDDTDLIGDKLLFRWRDSITMYKPRDKKALICAFQFAHVNLELSKLLYTERGHGSNYLDYCNSIDAIYSQLVQ